MMNREAYRYRLATKMADKFVKDLKEKTGLRASVMMDHLKASSQENLFLTRLVSLDMVEEVFLKAYPIKFDQNPLHTKGRKMEHVEARCVFCHIARERIKFSLPSIAKYIERDHTTIIHMTRRANNLLESDDKFINIYNKTIENLKSIYDQDITEYSKLQYKS